MSSQLPRQSSSEARPSVDDFEQLRAGVSAPARELFEPTVASGEPLAAVEQLGRELVAACERLNESERKMRARGVWWLR